LVAHRNIVVVFVDGRVVEINGMETAEKKSY
jgi:hypothetical protein